MASKIKTKALEFLNKNKNLMRFTILKIIGDGILFMFPILIAKFLKPEEYGAYSLGMMVVFFTTTLFLTSSSTPFIISANRENNSKKSISESFASQLIFFFISLSFIAVLFLTFGKLIIDFIHITPKLLFLLYLAFVGISVKSLVSNYFLGINRKIFHARIGIIYGALLVILLLVLENTLANLFLIYFYASLVVAVIAIWKVDFKKIFPIKFSKKNFLEQWDFTKWQMFGLTAAYFINWGDSIIINHFATVFDVGVYNLAYQVFKGLFTFMYIINTFYLPLITKRINDKSYINHYLYKTRMQLYFLGSLGVLGLIIVSPYLFTFFDKEYESAIVILQILLIGIFFKFWSIFYTPIFNVMKKYKFSQIMNVNQIILNVILGVIFIKFWGINGVAIATTLTYFLRGLADEIFFRVKLKGSIT